MSDDRTLRNRLIRVAFENPELRPEVLPLLVRHSEEVRAKVARVFPSEDALKAYLKKHPKANPSKHSVGKGRKPSKGKKQPGDGLDKDLKSKVQKMSPAERKKVLQRALAINDVESKAELKALEKKTKGPRPKDLSREMPALRGLSPEAQQEVIQRALKMHK